MKILVTGSEGGIGREIVAELARQWPDDRIMRVSRTAIHNTIMADLRDRPRVREVFEMSGHQPEIVIHAAATPYTSGGDAYRREEKVLQADLQITLNLLEAATRAGTRHVVFLSSSTVYEHCVTYDGSLREPMTDNALMPSSAIGMTKLVGERAVTAWAKADPLRTFTIWRLFNVVTPHERHDRPGHVYVDLYRKLFVELVPRLELDGAHNVRCFTWVRDVAWTVAKHIDPSRFASGGSRNRVINLGGEEAVTIRKLATTLLETGHRLGILPLDYTPPIVSVDRLVPDDVRVPSLGSSRALGWYPTPFDQCIERFVRGKHGMDR